MRLAYLSKDQVSIRIGLYVEVDDQPCLTSRRVDRIHVVHVVHAAHLLLNWRCDRLFHCLRVRADVSRLHLHFRGRDRGELGDGKANDRDCANDHGQDRDHDSHDRSIDEKL